MAALIASLVVFSNADLGNAVWGCAPRACGSYAGEWDAAGRSALSCQHHRSRHHLGTFDPQDWRLRRRSVADDGDQRSRYPHCLGRRSGGLQRQSFVRHCLAVRFTQRQSDDCRLWADWNRQGQDCVAAGHWKPASCHRWSGESSFPRMDGAIWSSSNGGKTWQKPSWIFSGLDGAVRPQSFVNFGKAYSGARDGYVYLLAPRAVSDAERVAVYLLRVPTASLHDRLAYQYFAGTSSAPAWTSRAANARPVFRDPNGVRYPVMVYNRHLARYLLTVGHTSAGQLGVFVAREPWGPWFTVSYRENWLGLAGGEYLPVHLPSKWINDDGRTLWAVFSCYNRSARAECGSYHDRLNVLRLRLKPTASN